MKVVIVNCFDTYEERIDMVANYYKNKGYSVKVISSNFQHIMKEYRETNKKGYLYVETVPYKKNLSVKRMFSHVNFGKKAFEIVAKENPDILYVAIPPNSLVKYANSYKKRNPNVKLLFDIIDLWPETMPKFNLPFNPIYRLWKNLRKENISIADFVITECNYYKERLGDELDGIDTQTIFLSKKKSQLDKTKKINSDKIVFCYLGSINNIIDIDKIVRLLSEINKLKPVKINIIGDGENKDVFIRELERKNIEVYFYGKIFKQEIKQQLFNESHFGLNIMKKSVEVALTMKSLDFFEGSLPIINNIKGDTEDLVKENKIGFNLTDDLNKDIMDIINLTPEMYLDMQMRVSKVFDNLFTVEKFSEKMDFINSVIKEKL